MKLVLLEVIPFSGYFSSRQESFVSNLAHSQLIPGSWRKGGTLLRVIDPKVYGKELWWPFITECSLNKPLLGGSPAQHLEISVSLWCLGWSPQILCSKNNKQSQSWDRCPVVKDQPILPCCCPGPGRELPWRSLRDGGVQGPGGLSSALTLFYRKKGLGRNGVTLLWSHLNVRFGV